MARRIPIVSTLVVAIAVATMVALGFWQIHRAQERDMAARHQRERAMLPAIAYPFASGDLEPFRYRRLFATCDHVAGWREMAGTSSSGQSGWRYIADCLTLEGKHFPVEMGVGLRPNQSIDWEGGAVIGRSVIQAWTRPRGDVVADTLVIVAETPAPGLAPSRQPTPGAVANSSWSYAVQWFLFAATALVIYALAVRKRWRG